MYHVRTQGGEWQTFTKRERGPLTWGLPGETMTSRRPSRPSEPGYLTREKLPPETSVRVPGSWWGVPTTTVAGR